MSVEVWWSTLVAADRGLLEILDETERARVESLDRAADRGRSMLGAALLRVAVAAHVGVPPGDLVVDRTCPECGGPHGPPRVVAAGRTPPHVSVSHSGVVVMVALSRPGPVGVDVQRVTDVPGHALEWVRREAMVKAAGGADARDRPHLIVRDLPPPLPGYAAALAAPTGAGPVREVRHWPEAAAPSWSP